MRTSILRPGFIVGMKSHVETGVRYSRRALSTDQPSSDSAVTTKWEVTKIEPDPAETKRAQQARNKARSEILNVCVQSRYVDICPVDREAELDAAEVRACAIVDAHNAGAVTTRIYFYPSKWQIADANEATIRKLGQEMVDLLSDMSAGIDRADPSLIRESVKRAKEMTGMLADEQVKAVVDAVEQARKAANTIARRVERKGEEIADVIRDVQRGAIEKARFAFLDLDDSTPAIAGEALPAVDARRFAVALDVDAEDEAPEAPESAPDSSEAPQTVAAASA